jgi:tetratricopeptide (TPR) repeat protein
MRPTIILAFFLTVATSVLAQSQSDIDKAIDIGRQGIEAADAGDYDRAIGLYEQAIKLDPSEPTYPYEIAYVRYLQKDYEYVVKNLTELIRHERATDVFYQLLGNSHDILKAPQKAIEVYEAGLKRFPKSGPLHLERGLMSMMAKDYDAAVGYWEKGIEADPRFPSNYYWAAKLYCNSSERIWGVLYGEIFMNLEMGTNRSDEISRLLYDTYRASITLRGESGAGIDFAPNVSRIDPGKIDDFKVPFHLRFGTAMSVATGVTVAGTKEGRTADTGISIGYLHRIRSEFIPAWDQFNGNDSFPVALFDWHREMIKNKHFETYNYWLFSRGNSEETDEWMNTNAEKVKAFADWVEEHPLEITSENYFIRTKLLRAGE